jgi:putative colanic acid biosynthesis acetyltransferase WcaF
MPNDAPKLEEPLPAVAFAGGDEDTAQPVFQRLDRATPRPYTKTEYAKRVMWDLVHRLLFRTSPRPAFRWRAMLLRWFGARLGRPVFVRHTCRVQYPWLLEAGDWVQLGEDVVVYNLGPVRIGSHSTVSQGAYICAGSHDYTKPDLPLLRPPITIGRGVWIAAQAFIGPGVTVGDNSVVGARAVVTKDVPPGVIVAGNPARVIKPRPMTGQGTSSS